MTPKKTKDKKNKTETANRNSVEKRNYTEEEKVRIVKFLEHSKRKPIKFKKGKTDNCGNPSIEIENGGSNLVAAQCLESLGTSDLGLQAYLIDQLGKTFNGCGTPAGLNEEKVVQFCNNGMAILSGIQPRDEIESMLAVQMIGVHNMAMACISRAMISDQTFEGKQANVNQATKMLRTFTAQMEALKKYRGGGQQVVVKHIYINEGGQAIVGNVNQGGGGSYEKKGG